MKTFLVLAFVAIIVSVNCDCGCLKCSKHLTVVSPPHLPYKVIYRGAAPSCRGVSGVTREIPFEVQIPIGGSAKTPTKSHLDYTIEAVPLVYNMGCNSRNRQETYYDSPRVTYSYDVQTPILSPSASKKSSGLIARPDRIVLPAPNLVRETCGQQVIQSQPQYYQSNSLPTLLPIVNAWSPPVTYQPQPAKIVAKRTGPIIERLPDDYFRQNCDCRYAPNRVKRRSKRDLPILSNSIKFLMGLLPSFLKFPLEQTLKSFQYHQKPQTMYNKYYQYVPLRDQRLLQQKLTNRVLEQKPTRGSLLYKLEKINHDKRFKRSLAFHDNNQISLPFFRVTSIEDSDDDEESSDSDEEYDSSSSSEYNPEEEYMKPLNFPHIIPHNPIFYILNTPIRLLRHFHQFGKQISPVVKSFPQVLINSRRYLRNFGRSFKNDVLNIASNLIGDFDEPYHYHRIRRRSVNANDTIKKLEPYEPEYSLVFPSEQQSRSKRYILKVCDEDEVEEYLREQLEGLVGVENKKHATNKDNKKKLVVEKLDSKIIIDNKGRPFVEINGSKRPLFLKNTKTKQKSSEETEDQSEDVKDKISALIDKARGRVDNTQMYEDEVSVKIIKDRIKQILNEIQDLINIDFDQYSKIYNDLAKLQSFKEFLVNDWKKILLNEKSDTSACQIRILDDFNEMQVLKDKAVSDIAEALSNGSNFMAKKLIKMLVRLQKLQCIIYRVVEDFEEKIKMGTNSDVSKDIKYCDFMSSLHFVIGKSKHDLQSDLKKERDKALENEMKILEDLKKLLECNSNEPNKLYEEAKLLWEIKNLEKLQKNTVEEMNEKISRGQKVRKELKILFDLLRQLENCEERQRKLFEEKKKRHSYRQIDNGHRLYNKEVKIGDNFRLFGGRNKLFPRRTIIDDKKPVKLLSNGYRVTAYKVSDGFN